MKVWKVVESSVDAGEKCISRETLVLPKVQKQRALPNWNVKRNYCEMNVN